MENTTQPQRATPAEKGQNNDPNSRDEDATQGGNVTSPGKNDEANQHLTRTSSDDYREDKPGDEKADKRFDE